MYVYIPRLLPSFLLPKAAAWEWDYACTMLLKDASLYSGMSRLLAPAQLGLAYIVMSGQVLAFPSWSRLLFLGLSFARLVPFQGHSH